MQTTDLRRKYPRLPDAKFLSPKILELDEEARKLAERRREAVAEQVRLADEHLDELASGDDRMLAGAAIRNGLSGQSAGSPNMDQLMSDRKAVSVEVAALGEAIQTVEDEMQAEFQRMVSDDKSSGRSALGIAKSRYHKAIEALVKARTEYVELKAVAAWMSAAADGSNSDVQAKALREANEPLPMAIPPGFGIDPRYAPKMPFEKHLAVLTAELAEEKS